MKYKVTRGSKHAKLYRWRVMSTSGLSVLFQSKDWNRALNYALLRTSGVHHKLAFSIARNGGMIPNFLPAMQLFTETVQ